MIKIFLNNLVLTLALAILLNHIHPTKVLGNDIIEDSTLEDFIYDDSTSDDSTVKDNTSDETIVSSEASLSSLFVASQTNLISTTTTTGQVTTRLFSTDSISTQIETTSKVITTKENANPALLFNTIIDIRGLVRNRRRNTAKRVIIKFNRILFIDDVNATNVEQVLLKSIGHDSNFSVTNEGNDEFSINFVTQINTQTKSELTLDDNVLRIVNNLKRDESIINEEANKVNFDSSIDTSKAIIYAIENLVINGTTNRQICEKSLDQVQMSCQEGKVVENGTYVVESNSTVEFETAFALSLEIPKSFLIFILSIYFFVHSKF